MADTDDAASSAKSVLTEEQARKEVDSRIGGAMEWYWTQTYFWERIAFIFRISILMMSTLVTVVAAYPAYSADPADAQWLKWLVVVISAITTLLSALLSKTGIEATAKLRERGRIEIVALEQKTLLRLTKRKMTETEREIYLEKFIEAIAEIERRYGAHPLVVGRIHSNK